MGLFSNKQGDDEAEGKALSSDVLADTQYREELQKLGREQFKEIIAEQADHLEKEIDAMMQRVTADVKVHTARRVDMLIGRLNAEVTNQMNERLREYNRVSAESQELVAKSLTQNAQMVHEKYQQLAMSMQQVVANQEVMMATVFQDSKTQVAAIQAEQTRIVDQLKQSKEQTKRQADELAESLRQTVTEQATKLNTIYQENLATVETTRDSQATMLEKLKATTDKLEQQHAQLHELLDSSIENQKKMVGDIINDNMARIVEHYLVAALGEQSSLREQLPSILERMEENKKAMADDMKL